MATNPALLALLGQQGLSSLPSGNPLEAPRPPVVIPETVAPEEDVIDVTGLGSLAAPQADPMDVSSLYAQPAAPSLGNADWIAERDQANSNIPQRSGYLGVKGTLRDVLGSLGDAFLVQSGGKAMYAPHRQRENVADAMAGFTANPMAAIERVAQFDPEAAQGLYEQYQMAEYQKAQMKAAQSRAAIQGQKEDRTAFIERLKVAQGMMGAAKSPDEQQLVRQWLQNPEATLEGIPNHLLVASGINPYQAAQLQARQEQLEIARQNADANTTRANRPPAGRAAPNPTNASQAAPLLEKVRSGGKLTAGEEEVLTRLGYSKKKKGSGRQRDLSEPAATSPAKSGWGSMTVN